MVNVFISKCPGILSHANADLQQSLKIWVSWRGSHHQICSNRWVGLGAESCCGLLKVKKQVAEQRLKFKALDQQRIKCHVHLLHFQTYITCISINLQIWKYSSIWKYSAHNFQEKRQGDMTETGKGQQGWGGPVSLLPQGLRCHWLAQVACPHECAGTMQGDNLSQVPTHSR